MCDATRGYWRAYLLSRGSDQWLLLCEASPEDVRAVPVGMRAGQLSAAVAAATIKDYLGERAAQLVKKPTETMHEVRARPRPSPSYWSYTSPATRLRALV